MDRQTNTLLDELYELVGALGVDGGMVSASVYDTAVVLRYAPPKEGVASALKWLLDQQQKDGGWGPATTMLTRAVPTLAAVLALHHYRGVINSETAVRKGLAFLEGQAHEWHNLDIDDIPIAAELILPKLLREAEDENIVLDKSPYQELFLLGQKRLERIQAARPKAGSSPAHSWEAWGEVPDLVLQDITGGIGHSPAATAAWLRAAQSMPELTTAREKARRYLRVAASATGLTIPGVVPTVWPITGFEHVYGLYTLIIAGLWDHPRLEDLITFKTKALACMAQPDGFAQGEGTAFVPDGDDTATALAVLYHAGYITEWNVLRRYQKGNHFITFPHEMNPSLLTTAHGTYAMAKMGEDVQSLKAFIVQRQQADGVWPADKWHSSWAYNTLEVMMALLEAGEDTVLKQAVAGWRQRQFENGGWGSNGKPSVTETSYAVLSLSALARQSLLDISGLHTLQNAYGFLSSRMASKNGRSLERLWVGKEAYRPLRVDRLFELASVLSVQLNQDIELKLPRVAQPPSVFTSSSSSHYTS